MALYLMLFLRLNSAEIRLYSAAVTSTNLQMLAVAQAVNWGQRYDLCLRKPQANGFELCYVYM